MKRVLLIDGDIFVYLISTSLETPIDWGDDFWTLHVDARAAKEKMVEKIEELKDTLKADDMVFALSNYDKPFRKAILPTYKYNRKTVRKPVVWGEMRQFLKDHYVVKEKPSLEGDDILGIMGTMKVKNEERIIVTLDKDLLTVPGKLYNFGKPELGVVEVTEQQADYMHMMQTLTGDTTDGYSGCPGIGPAKAEKLLGQCQKVYSEMWPIVVEAFRKAGLGSDAALSFARVARILRASDYDFKKGQVKLWQPPSGS